MSLRRDILIYENRRVSLVHRINNSVVYLYDRRQQKEVYLITLSEGSTCVIQIKVITTDLSI